MEDRENALREALKNNSVEVERWKNYKKENELAIENLERFSKLLEVDVMVPLGSKAYIPGQLIHTNEILVGHYQDYFSDCSAYKAKEICNLRIRMAEERLKKLAVETEMYQNKLEKPYVDGVVPNAEQREIIEDYNEEQEQRWRLEHRKRVKESKLRERENKKINTDDDEILLVLEEAELREELERELDELKLDEVNVDTIKMLMTGDILPTEKTSRVSHSTLDNESDPSTENNSNLEKPVVVKSSELEFYTATNNNTRTNTEIASECHDENNSQDEEIEEELLNIRSQAKYLPTKDRICFYEYQIQILQEKTKKMLCTYETLNDKVRLYSVIDGINEEIELLLEELSTDELTESEESNNSEAKPKSLEPVTNDEQPRASKRRISFALSEETVEFRQNETVSDMLSKPGGGAPPKRDIITLNEPIDAVSAPVSQKDCSTEGKRLSIIDKVEQNLQYMAENQSQENFDLINRILDVSARRINTFHISFHHSDSVFENGIKGTGESERNAPTSPADFYSDYLKLLEQPSPSTFFTNAYKGEELVHAPILSETKRQSAYEDPKAAFSVPGTFATIASAKGESPQEPVVKPILRNKSAVERETHILNNKKQVRKKLKKKEASIEDGFENMSAFLKVMDEVKEKSVTAPEPLPDGQFIDVHAPKRRISRFKQQRSGQSLLNN